VIDPVLNRDAVGAKIVVRAGGTQRVGMVCSSSGFLSAGPASVHFGLGRASAVDGYEVTWPDGTRESFPAGAADRRVELQRGSGTTMMP
jgi:enediyne biosynthesis protein E4